MKFNIIIILSVLLWGCKRDWSHVYISSKFNEEGITIITKNKVRYIFPGDSENIPKEHIVLDISKVDRLGDAISICWNSESKKWKIFNGYATLIQNTLDTNQFAYKVSLGKYGEPSGREYIGENCGGFLIREFTKPRGPLIVEYK